MENKQTALEWFFDNLKNHEIQAEHYELYQQAKQLEKEQIIKAYQQGVTDEYGDTLDFTNDEDGKQYYTENYGK